MPKTSSPPTSSTNGKTSAKTPTQPQVALLIDADNAQLNCIEQVLKISRHYGQLKICRAFGDWTKPPLLPWREKLKALKLKLIQVDRVGKNATDGRLWMDAGGILEKVPSNGITTFIIVSSDGDFSTPCKRIQAKGLKVIGIGNKSNTSSALRKACDKFHYFEDLDYELSKLEKSHPTPPKEIKLFYKSLVAAYHELSPEGDWVLYSRLGAKLRESERDYDKLYGKHRLSVWLKNFEQDFEIRDQMIKRR